MSIYQFQIGEQFPNTIQTGDYSRLNDREIQCLEDFLDGLPESGSWEFAENGQYARCAVMREVNWCYLGEFSPIWQQEAA